MKYAKLFSYIFVITHQNNIHLDLDLDYFHINEAIFVSFNK